MRQSQKPVDTRSLPWQEGNNSVRFQLLNGSREKGPYTLLLRSEAREPNPRRGQYHPADEEFFCLGGDFTFDGSTWLKKGSYAFYPEYFVHGTKVYVKGGYELYIRISGTSKVFWEDAPVSDDPYRVDGDDTDDFAVQYADVSEIEYEHSDIPGVLVKPLHIARHTGEGSTLIAFSEDTPEIVFEAANLIEVFSLSGNFRSDGEDEMPMHSYMCSAKENALVRLECLGAGELLISHGGELKVRIA